MTYCYQVRLWWCIWRYFIRCFRLLTYSRYAQRSAWRYRTKSRAYWRKKHFEYGLTPRLWASICREIWREIFTHPGRWMPTGLLPKNGRAIRWAIWTVEFLVPRKRLFRIPIQMMLILSKSVLHQCHPFKIKHGFVDIRERELTLVFSWTIAYSIYQLLPPYWRSIPYFLSWYFHSNYILSNPHKHTFTPILCVLPCCWLLHVFTDIWQYFDFRYDGSGDFWE
jgi:hypothetical protein